MNLKTFEELITDPERLNKDTQSELEQLLKEYPFCQTFHLLYTRNLYQLKHIRYQQQLKVAAAIVGDRTRLKHFVEGSPLPFTGISEPLKESDVIPIVPQIAIEEETITPPVCIETPEVIQVNESEGEESAYLPVIDFIPKLRPRENQQEVVPSGSSTSVEWDAGDESVLSSSINVEVSREERKKAIIALINKKFNERLALSLNKSVDPSPVSDIPLVVITEDDSQELEQLIVEDEVASLNEIAPSLESKEVTPSTDLIEKFLRDSPRMSRPKKEFYNPVNLAARSIEENEDFYTETYAYICLKQGNAEKAIKIYEKLSLKFPEKSSYFAGLIEKIKKEQNI
jgi:tetratricopeptide (TPR) repeat protein